MERPAQRPECQAERIRIADARPEAHAGAAGGQRSARAEQPDLRLPPGFLLEARRLHQPAQLARARRIPSRRAPEPT